MTSKNGPTVCIKAARAALLGAGASGLDPAAFASSFGLTAAVLADPYARIPHARLVSMWRELPRAAGSEAVGLRAAERVAAAPLHLMDYAVQHCATVGEALLRLSRYARLLHDACEIRLLQEGGEARFVQRFACEPEMPGTFVEFIFASWVLRARALSGVASPARAVSFRHEAPRDVGEHERLFGLAPWFGAPRNEIAFDAALLGAPIIGADPLLAAMLDRHADELLKKLDAEGEGAPDDRGFVASVRRLVASELPSGAVDIGPVARKLGMSQRSFQRRLRAEGTTWSALVDEVRREVAVDRLRDASATLSEVAFFVGFSEASAFTRAFRRWTGTTPAAFRRSAQGCIKPRWEPV
jgi:AraC-like DNA-binding protein